jgi:hypothetical protein
MGSWLQRGLELAPTLAPLALHLTSLRRRLAAIARRLPPEATPPSERSIDSLG